MTGWGEEGTEEIPPDIWAQVQHEMLVTGADRCDVAVLFGHHTFRVYPIARNEEFLGPLVPKLEAFWYGNVIARVPPAPGPNDGPYVAAMHPTNDGSMSSATPEQESLIRQLLIALGNVQQAQLAKQELENRVKRLIGDRDGLTGSFGTITWKQVRDSKTTDWELVAKVRGDMVDQLLEMANPGGDEEAVRKLAHIQSLAPGVVALYTRIVPGYRRMNYTLKEEA
jgi:predicted phage-related endonuclease